MPFVLTQPPPAAALGVFLPNSPLAIVIVLSLVVGLLMVLLFGYTSNQKAIKVAKDQLKAHLLAVRLYQDQLPVVLRTYGRIILGTGRYIRLAFMPLLYVIIPITLLIVQVDRYLGSVPMQTAQPFLVTVQTAPDTLNGVSLQLPAEMSISAPAVHVPADNEVVWRVVAQKDGEYDINVLSGGQTYSKTVVVAGDVSRLSPERMRDRFWERIFVSGEPALPDSSPIESIAVTYLPRNINFAWLEWNWIVLFFVLSMVAGFIFKEVLGIEI
ncbi:MAG: hypothetical protein LAN83_16175 [Acidobacteriia bacterium]|nr:hypothetical protein [Terriglobia bacterium]